MNRAEIRKQVTALACGLIRVPLARRRDCLLAWIESVLDADPPPWPEISVEHRAAALIFVADEAYQSALRIEAGRDPHPGLDEMEPSGPVN